MTPIAGRPAVKAVLCEAVVLHAGWEMDNRAWAVELDDDNVVTLCTRHGAIVEWQQEDILEKLNETRRSAASVEMLLD